MILAACCACTNKEVFNDEPLPCIDATTVSPFEESRTSVSSVTDGANVSTVWTAGDELGVFDRDGNHKRFLRKTSGNETNPKFYPESGYVTPKYAYYPYGSDNAGRSSSDCLGNVPAVQEMTSGVLHGAYKTGTLKRTSFFSNTYTMTFSHILSVVEVDLNADGTVLADDVLKTVKVSVKRGEDQVLIAGSFHFSAVNGSIASSNLGSESAITMDWEEGVALSGTISRWISVLPVVKAGDVIRFEITGESHNAVLELTAEKAFEQGKGYVFDLSLSKYSDVLVVDGVAPGTEPEPTPEPEPEPEPTPEPEPEPEPTPEPEPEPEPEPTPEPEPEPTPEPEPEPTPEPEPEPAPVVTSGTFKAAAFNVDGLPNKVSFVTINPDGPGSSGTSTMAKIANGLGWDIIAASEDFAYHSQLASGLSNYNAGTYRGSISSAQLYKRADTDGMCFFWKKNGVSASSETMVQYKDEYGGLTSGANTCIKKGFRYYEVTIAEGVVIDVYITHMNTYSGSGNTESNAYVAAVLGQLRQLRDYVLAKAAANKRPAVIMGDTNMRYTRHDIQKNLLDYVASWTDANGVSGYTVSDPWVEKYRGGFYPSWNSKSLMTRAMFKGDTENDIVCSNDQRGEVVDKIWYVNVPGAAVQLSVEDHYNDVTNFTKSTSSVSYSGVQMEDANGNISSGNISYTKNVGYSDHFPVVTVFKWTKTE